LDTQFLFESGEEFGMKEFWNIYEGNVRGQEGELVKATYRGAGKSLARPGRKTRYSDRIFWVSYILFI